MELHKWDYKRLAVDINVYLRKDVEDKSYPSKRYKDLIAEEVIEAIKNRRTIYLGCLEGTKFDGHRGHPLADPALGTPSHVFTAWSRARSGGKALDDVHPERLLGKIVSVSRCYRTNFAGSTVGYEKMD